MVAADQTACEPEQSAIVAAHDQLEGQIVAVARAVREFGIAGRRKLRRLVSGW